MDDGAEMRILARRTVEQPVNVSPAHARANEAVESDVGVLWREVRGQHERRRRQRETVERNAAFLEDARRAEQDGRREDARLVARGELSEDEQATRAADRGEAIAQASDALDRSADVLAAVEEAYVAAAEELEQVALGEADAGLSAINKKAEELRARLAEVEVQRDLAEQARETLADELRTVRMNADPQLAQLQKTLDAQRREQIASYAKQPEWRWRQEAPRLLHAAIEAERERLRGLETAARERDLALAERSWREAGGSGPAPTRQIG